MSDSTDTETTPLEREVNAGREGTTTIEHFGRTWVIPIKRHARHKKVMTDAVRSGVGDYQLMVVETFLSDLNHDHVPAGQVAKFFELNPDDEATQEFAKKISASLGFTDTGN